MHTSERPHGHGHHSGAGAKDVQHGSGGIGNAEEAPGSEPASPRQRHGGGNKATSTAQSRKHLTRSTTRKAIGGSKESRRAWQRAGFKVSVVSALQKGVKSNTHKLADEVMIEAAFTDLPIFSGCGEEFLGDVAKKCSLHRLFPGQTIATQGNAAMSMIIVIEGTLQLVVNGETCATLKTGQMFGETMLLGVDHHWGASLEVLTSCLFCELTQAGFKNVLAEHRSEAQVFERLRLENEDCADGGTGTLTNRCTLFNGLSEEFVCAVDKLIVRRLFFPGEKFIVEGEKTDELYILVRGTARVTIANRLIRMERSTRAGVEELYKDSQTDGSEVAKRSYEPICFGELALLGMQESRSASVAAETCCHMRILYRQNFLQALESRSEAVHISNVTTMLQDRYKDSSNKNSDRKAALEMLQKVPVFIEVGCSEGFLKFLADHLEDRIFLQGQKIVDEHSTASSKSDDRSMYLIGQGKARVFVKGKEVAVLDAGAVIGEVIALGFGSKRTATVVTASTCYMYVLHQSVVVQGLELFPEERAGILTMAMKNQDSESMNHSDMELMSSAEAHCSKHMMVDALKRSPVLANVSTAFILELSAVAHDRIYMPGEFIIEQGTKGDSMFIMVCGSADVYTKDTKRASDGHLEQLAVSKVGKLVGGSVCGELAMVGVAHLRSATIEASTICCMWEILQDDALAIIDQHPDALEHFSNIIIEHLERTVPARLVSLPLFKAFDQKFRTLLGIYSERRAYFPGKQILREGQNLERLFIVNSGRCLLEKKGVSIKTFSSGTHFGSTVMLGIHKSYIGTLTALQTCHIIAISRDTFTQAMEQYPSLAATQALKISEKKVNNALREASLRIATRKLIYNRYQNLVDTGHCHKQVFSTTQDQPDTEVLLQILMAWREFAINNRNRRNQARRENQTRKDMMYKWVQERGDAIERAQLRRDMEIKIPNAIADNGPLKLPSITPNGSTGKGMVTCYFEGWPSPRRSPHYELRVYDVLRSTRGGGGNLLPLIAERDQSRMSQPTPRSLRLESYDAEDSHDSLGGEEASPNLC